MTSFETDETKRIFREECSKILGDFEQQLDIFKKTKNTEIIVKLMRDAHSIKGSAGITGLLPIQNLAHKTEDLLAELKEKSDDRQIFIEITKLVNEIKNLVSNSSSKEDILDEIILKIPKLKNNVSEAEILCKRVEQLLCLQDMPMSVIDILSDINNIFYKISTSVRIKDNKIINILLGGIKTVKKVINAENDSFSDELILLKQRVSVAEQMIDVYVEFQQSSPKSEKSQVQKPKIELQNIFTDFPQNSIKTLRVETEKIDNLSEKVYKLEKIRNILKEENQRLSDIAVLFASKMFVLENCFEEIKQQIKTNNINGCVIDFFNMEKTLKDIQSLSDTIKNTNSNNAASVVKFEETCDEIRKSVLNIRSLPIGVILHMFPRMVRDIADAENKKIEINITGTETFVDKKILEEIKMPLIHLLRNAVDHGIESPQDREKLGKNEAGKISISVKNINSKTTICVKDDGCGINFDKIKKKALKDKLLGKNEIKTLNKHDFLKILFRPGFSTEEKITEISGRGIGLDIVYTKINELNGNIKINTEKGKGTEIIMEFPMFFEVQKAEEKTEIKHKIAVVDDSYSTKIYLKNILEKEGFEVLAFDNAKDALKELKKTKVNLVVSDVEMPVMNGVEFVSKLRKTKNYKNIPVIVVSMLKISQIQNMFNNVKVEETINKSNFDEKYFISSVRHLINN